MTAGNHGGRPVWNGHAWVVPQSLPKKNRGWKIAAAVVGFLIMLGLIGNLGDDEVSSVATTVTKTVTQTPQAFAQMPAETVTVTAQAAPAPTITITEAAPQQDVAAVVPAPVVDIPVEIPMPALESSAYYGSCADARAAGAAPLYIGSPGYRSGLDRDGDGVACES